MIPLDNNLQKVIFFTNGLVGVGGAERVLLEAALYFQKKKIDVIIVTFVLDDVSLMNYKHKLKIVNLASFNYFKRIFLLRKSIKKFKPNIIIGQSSLDCMYLYLSLFFHD